MQIILISDRLGKARTLTISARLLVLSAASLVAVAGALAAALYSAGIHLALELRLPAVRQLLAETEQRENERARQFLQQNLNAMAIKLGEMQAQLLRLDALGERLSALTGVLPQDFRFSDPFGMGGAQASAIAPQDLTLPQLAQRVAAVSRDVEQRTDLLSTLDAQLFLNTVNQKLLPTMLPVQAHFNASSFGMRIDPISGQHAMHEGIDFIADAGTPVVAAAGGVVQFAGYHPQYGYVIDLDHSNDLVTRYAHLSKMLVEEGALVHRGRKIGEVGNSGRSTGPHLHFEVRLKGAAQNPARFLLASKQKSPRVPSEVASAR
ncbi:MAG TPA: M23 family metallopeptidase [Burkholderiales bacterium]|nr:M23 family metallopeptidase [Burkholderiales bacterium]